MYPILIETAKEWSEKALVIFCFLSIQSLYFHENNFRDGEKSKNVYKRKPCQSNFKILFNSYVAKNTLLKLELQSRVIKNQMFCVKIHFKVRRFARKLQRSIGISAASSMLSTLYRCVKISRNSKLYSEFSTVSISDITTWIKRHRKIHRPFATLRIQMFFTEPTKRNASVNVSSWSAAEGQ